jgi:mannitol-1-phosphate/altronate dehydrogenase
LHKWHPPQPRIVSLTITEGGYYIDQSTGNLDDKHPDIQYDLAHPHEPRCSFGYLLEALDRRRICGLPPFTLMSAWESVGAQMTTDVLPYEKMKLRLLNASHQALCYIGMLLGYELVHETMEDQHIRKLVEKMMDDEVTPLLSEVPGVNLTDYKKTLIERFGNPAIRDQLSRIGIYGSSGIPKFLLPSLEEQLQR